MSRHGDWRGAHRAPSRSLAISCSAVGAKGTRHVPARLHIRLIRLLLTALPRLPATTNTKALDSFAPRRLVPAAIPNTTWDGIFLSQPSPSLSHTQTNSLRRSESLTPSLLAEAMRDSHRPAGPAVGQPRRTGRAWLTTWSTSRERRVSKLWLQNADRVRIGRGPGHRDARQAAGSGNGVVLSW